MKFSISDNKYTHFVLCVSMHNRQNVDADVPACRAFGGCDMVDEAKGTLTMKFNLANICGYNSANVLANKIKLI